ncbi:MAG: YggS family pyridoxal phosphate-dependent enzyme [Gemmatimonadetes bacterium]|nr:MAG: YggS family pyridoxal phosphate-dependent enzyme [Gemmatimonadota bacterium]
MNTIHTRIAHVRERMATAAARAGRSVDEITLIAVSKTRTLAEIQAAIDAGITVLGENRVQEAETKIPKLPAGTVTWHLIGHLQKNKINKALDLFSLIHSVDSYKLAEAISKRALQRQKVMDVLIEVNTSGEASKFGVDPDHAIELVKSAASLEGIRIQGLMTVGPFLDDAEAIRPCFSQLRHLRDHIQTLELPNVSMRHLSMGMTNDFEVAIEEGATLIRVGTAIFGARTYP